MMTKKNKGDISFPVVLVVFIALFALGVIILLAQGRTIVQTKVDIQNIGQGDTMLLAMLDSSACAPISGAPFKYVLGTGLARAKTTTSGENPVQINYNGVTENIDVKKCVEKFMQGIQVSNYRFYVEYGCGITLEYSYEKLPCYDYSSATYKANERKKTETMYVSVPDSKSGIAEVVLSTNLPPESEKVCPEGDGTHLCTPETYCLLSKGSCNAEYSCGGALCCCA